MGNNRRDFLKKSALLGLLGVSANLVGEEKLNALQNLSEKINADGKFTLPSLPYAYNSLEPFIDAQTMEIHHSKHHQAYVDKLNKALENYKGDNTLTNLLAQSSKTDVAIRNNGGGHYNHSLFWQLLKPNPTSAENLPTGKLAEAIVRDFKSYDNFKKEFSEKSLKNFGSGWCWLIAQNGIDIIDKTGLPKLKIITTSNQDNPYMVDVIPFENIGLPVLALDVWEHAYYLKYQNKRADYINNWWNIVNWQAADNIWMGK